MKIAQFLQAGCNVKILLADVHGFLDNLKAPIELVEYRAKYYRYCITALLRAVNVPIDSPGDRDEADRDESPGGTTYGGRGAGDEGRGEAVLASEVDILYCCTYCGGQQPLVNPIFLHC